MDDLINFIRSQSIYTKISGVLAAAFSLLTIILMVFHKPDQPEIPRKTEVPKVVETSKLPDLEKQKKNKRYLKKMNESEKKEININSGVNNGSIGGTHTTNTYNFGIQPRTVNAADMDEFEKAFPEKTVHVRFCAFGGSDAEMFAVKSKIIAMLRERGYNDIDEEWNILYGKKAPEIITIERNSVGAGGASFLIPFAK